MSLNPFPINLSQMKLNSFVIPAKAGIWLLNEKIPRSSRGMTCGVVC